MEKSVSELFNWIMTGIIIIAILTISMLLYFTNQRNAFINQSSEIIQRTGGLTSQTIREIDDLSDKNYNSMFTIINPDNITNENATTKNEQVSYGDEIDFAVTTTLPIVNMTIDKPDPDNWKVTTVTSEIRKGSQSFNDTTTGLSSKHQAIRQDIAKE